MMNMKRIASALLALLMVLSVLVIVPVSAADETNTTTGALSDVGYSDSLVTKVNLTNVADIKDYDANSSAKAFKITDVDGYKKFVSIVNSVTDESVVFSGVTVYLADDIDISEVTDQKPIGYYNGYWNGEYVRNSAAKFGGTFDGQGHKITGIDVSGSVNDLDQFAGFFGYTQNATIKNVSLFGKVSQSVVEDKTNHATNDMNGCGGLIARADGTSTITNVYCDIDVLGKGINSVAGFVGRGATANITNCTNAGDIVNDSIGAGGFSCFSVAGTFTKCLNSGSIEARNHAAGIQSRSRCTQTISYCVNTGSITAANAGGILAAAEKNSNVTITNCANYGKISGTQKSGPFASGYTENGGKYTEENNAYADLTEYETYPNCGSYQISNAAGLVKLSELVNGGNTMSGTVIALANDIDMTGVTMKPIGHYAHASAPSYENEKTITVFSGTFDGQNHKISNLNMKYSNKDTVTVALFGCARNATIKNVVIDATCSFELTYDNKIWGYDDCAAILARADGAATITNCVNYAKVTSGGANTGGIVARGATVSGCVNYGAITGGGTVGGIVGNNGGTTADCKNYGAVNGGTAAGIVGGTDNNGNLTIKNCENNGAVTGNGAAAGIATYRNGKATLSNCVNNATVTAKGQPAQALASKETAARTGTVEYDDGCASLLNIKYQEATDVTEEGTNLRLITTVDSLDYSKVVFSITYNGETKTVDLETAYDTIVAGEFTVTPAQAGVSTSQYILALVLTGIPEGTTFTVQATAYDANGNAVLQGAVRTIEIPAASAAA